MGAVGGAESGESDTIEQTVVEDVGSEETGKTGFCQIKEISVKVTGGVSAEDHTDTGGVAGRQLHYVNKGFVTVNVFGADPAGAEKIADIFRLLIAFPAEMG